MLLKGMVPEIIMIAVTSITGGICAAFAYRKGYKRGYENGYDFRKSCESLERELKGLKDAIKSRKASNKKEASK